MSECERERESEQVIRYMCERERERRRKEIAKEKSKQHSLLVQLLYILISSSKANVYF